MIPLGEFSPSEIWDFIMPELRPITSETLIRMSHELTWPPVPENQTAAVAQLLTGLAADMADYRKFSVGNAEPAMTYSPLTDSEGLTQ